MSSKGEPVPIDSISRVSFPIQDEDFGEPSVSSDPSEEGVLQPGSERPSERPSELPPVTDRTALPSSSACAPSNVTSDHGDGSVEPPELVITRAKEDNLNDADGVRKRDNTAAGQLEVGEKCADNARGRAHEVEEVQKQALFDDKPTKADEQRPVDRPTRDVCNLQQQASRPLHVLLGSTDSAGRDEAEADLARINEEIRKAIANEILPGDPYTIKIGQLLPISEGLHGTAPHVVNGMERVADGLSDRLIRRFDGLCQRPENQRPADWTCLVRDAISAVYRQAGRDFEASGPARRQRQPRSTDTDEDGDRKMLDRGDPSADNADDETRTEEQPPATDGGPEARTKRAWARPLQPGRTLDGETILGHRPWFGRRRDGTPYGVTFVVQTRARNPVELRRASALGGAVRDAYFRLPDGQKHEIRQTGALDCEGMLDEILGYACYPDPYSGTLPDGAAWYRLKNGEKTLISRRLLRAALGQDVADWQVSSFFHKNRLELPYGQLRLPPAITGRPGPGRQGGQLRWQDRDSATECGRDFASSDGDDDDDDDSKLQRVGTWRRRKTRHGSTEGVELG